MATSTKKSAPKRAPRKTPARKKAKQLAKLLRKERPSYDYLRDIFRHLREELEVEVPRASKRLPDVPTEEEIAAFYKAVWNARRFQDMVLIKTFLYTGMRVSELAIVRLEELDLERVQIRIN